MIPAVLTRQVRQGVEDFLRTTFPMSTPYFDGMLERFLTREKELFQGPYVSIRLPFRQGSGSRHRFTGIPLPFTPHLHQEKAWERLTGDNGKSTIVATGTGSGKTECFLYPILDYCLRHAGTPGIKAIIIYPMNALATDQAGRFAREIYKTPALREANIRVGLYVGEREKNPCAVMTRDKVITDKTVLRTSPPDILLTNYKMLDYLMIRPNDRELWQHNRPETLKYLVVDELHTFDGAQGTDLACLIRRLKARLEIQPGNLCCVGTSATLGDEGALGELIEFTGQLFGEEFDEHSVITEDRLTAAEFLADSLIESMKVPSPGDAALLDPENYSSQEEYLRHQIPLWFDWEPTEEDMSGNGWRVQLGDSLKGHFLFQNIVKQVDSRVLSYDAVLQKMERLLPGRGEAAQNYRSLVLTSLLSLISAARIRKEEAPSEAAIRETDDESRPVIPFLQVSLSIWLRELVRMVATVATPDEDGGDRFRPELHFSDDLKPETLRRALPVIHCRECWATGWTSVKKSDGEHETVALEDLKVFYNLFFNRHPDIVYIFPKHHYDAKDGLQRMLCGNCLSLFDPKNAEQCPVCLSKRTLPVFLPDAKELNRAGHVETSEDCPFCGSKKSLTILGYRSAGLSSVIISQLYASPYNDDKKLLAFSDSVQDAAHRAGFFGARTYRFNLRTAIQRFVQDGGGNLSLTDFTGAFCAYWENKMTPEEFVVTFLPPDKVWFNDYQEMLRRGHLPAGSSLIDDVKNRLVWEIHSEYGLNSRIGRTLEKSGCSVLIPQRDNLMKATDIIQLRITNELEPLRNLDRSMTTWLVVGLLLRLKENGAIFHPMLDGYIEHFGNPWHLGHIHKWLPAAGPQTRTPIFLSQSMRRKNYFDTLRKEKGHSWYERWYDKCMGDIYVLSDNLINEVYRIVLDELTAAEVIRVRMVQGKRVWGLNPDQLFIDDEVAQFRCSDCGHVLATGAKVLDLWDGAPCVRAGCPGKYTYDEALSTQTGYYGHLYSAGEVERVFAQEHTGLLDRNRREQIEGEFKAEQDKRKPWYPNLLSCTPTLEMGIDIGSLSSLILCSVPPDQAQYLQRVGRAGRKNGNAFHATVANAKPHDLLFYAEPLEMLQGNVKTPGIFLNASAVLERQLAAYCLDQWVKTGIPVSAVPLELGNVLSAWQSRDRGNRFPVNFLNFVEANQHHLVESFISLFEGTLSETTIQHLRNHLTGGIDGTDLRYRIAEKLEEITKEIAALQKKRRDLDRQIRRNKTRPRDEETNRELREMENEKAAIQGVIRQIKSKNTFNFLTDEGILPNYAFPESGVTLRSIIWRRREIHQEDGYNYETVIYDYERSAPAAIRELAPASTFYAGGRKVVIDRLDLSISEPETWRFCPNCSHAVQEGLEQHSAACPRCGDVRWSDEGQVRQMLRLRQVYANTEDKDSYITDSSDSRETMFFNQALLVDIAPENIQESYALVDAKLPFGYEYVTKATLREINLGLAEDYSGGFTVAGSNYRSQGFEVCRHCGKVRLPSDRRSRSLRHLPSCPVRDKGSDEGIMEFLCLYREMTSEAVRILLPVLDSDESVTVYSLIAALHLGLKRVFKGNIDHLATTLHAEPVPDAAYRKKYLVVYDTVPGGTGYLKQLLTEETSLLKVLRAALEVLESCDCRHDPEKDGCYRCLYSYRTSFQLEHTSRKIAVHLLSEILADEDKLEKITALDTLSINPLFDSELERKFIQALKKYHWDGTAAQVRKDIINGRPGWVLQIGEQVWLIEPQVTLAQADGVSVPARADFLLRPARLSETILPIAVFTDGYAFHHQRTGQDMAQRMAIVASGRFRIWSLSFKDIEKHIGRDQGDYYLNGLHPNHLANGSIVPQIWSRFFDRPFARLDYQDSFTWLARLLKQPEEISWKRAALTYAIAGTVPTVDREYIAQWREQVQAMLPFESDNLIPDDAVFFHQTVLNGRDGSPGISIYTALSQRAIVEAEPDGVFIMLQLHDLPVEQGQDYEAVWNGFIRLYNLFQFLPRSFGLTHDGIARNLYSHIVWRPGEPVPAVAHGVDVDDRNWEEVRSLVEPAVYPLLEKLASAGFVPPEVGMEILHESKVLAEAELAWEDRRILVLKDEYWPEATVLGTYGWQVFRLESILADERLPERLLQTYRGVGA